MNIGKAVYLAISARAWPLEELARRANTNVDLLRDLLDAHQSRLSAESEQLIADALEVPLQVLLMLGMDDDELGNVRPELMQKLRGIVLELLKPEEK